MLRNLLVIIFLLLGSSHLMSFQYKEHKTSATGYKDLLKRTLDINTAYSSEGQWWQGNIPTKGICSKYPSSSITGVELTTIDFETGRYQCEYTFPALPGEVAGSYTEVVGYQVKNYKAMIEDAVVSYSNIRFPADGEFYNDVIGSLNINLSNSTEEFIFNPKPIVQALGDDGILGKIAKLDNEFNLVEDVGHIYNGEMKLGSKEKTDRLTLSEVFLGITLLDEHYIKGIDRDGKLELTSDIEYKLDYQTSPYSAYANRNNILKDSNGSTSLYDSMMNSFSNLLTPTSESSILNSISLRDFMGNDEELLLSNVIEQGPLSLYVSFFATLMEGFEYIAYTLLFFVALYYIGTTVSQASISKLFPDKASQSASIISSPKIAALAGTFVVAFLTVNSNVTIYPLSNEETTINDSVSWEKDQVTNVKTTVAKNLITSIAMQGDQLATYVSDNMYLRYLQYRYRKITENLKKVLAKEDRKFKRNLIILKATNSFYQEACQKAYRGAYTGEDPRPNDSWKGGIMAKYLFMPSNINPSSTLESATIDDSHLDDEQSKKNRIKRWLVSPKLCIKLQDKINSRVDTAMNQFHTLVSTVRKIDSSNPIQSITAPMESFMISRLLSQFQFGWYNVISIPFMHSYFDVIADMTTSITLDKENSSSSALIQGSVNKHILQNKGEEKYDKNEELTDIKDFAQNIPYFIMPGFRNLHAQVKSILNTPEDGKAKGTQVEKMKKFLHQIFKTYGQGDIKKESGIVTVVSKLYNIQVKMIFTAIVSIFVLIKIVFWLFDALKYFFVSPFAVFWGIAKNNSQNALSQFVTRGFVLLMVKPLLIVVTVVLFVISYDMFFVLYNMTIANILNVADVAKSLAESFGGTLSASSGAVFALTVSLNSLFQVILNLVLVFVGYKMVMDGDNWILNVLGYQDQAISKNDMAAVASDLRMKLQNT
jgi:hypothetical protein